VGVKDVVKTALRAAGFELRRIPTVDEHKPAEDKRRRRITLMQNHGIDLVLDVGANTGQFGRLLRDLGFRGRIVSFEPLQDTFATLRQLTAHDALWECRKLALGHFDGTALMNVSVNSFSSSFLAVSARNVQIEPGISYVGEEKVNIRRLATILNSVAQPNNKIYLKIDTQGYELNVLNGALGIIDRFPLIQLETAFFEGYETQPVIEEIIGFLRRLRYRIVWIEPGWEDSKTGEMLEADLIFARD
jgi:FkbM family methyltransferase